jgi:hypothetical protein
MRAEREREIERESRLQKIKKDESIEIEMAQRVKRTEQRE